MVGAISTAGKAPVLGRRIRRQLEESLPANLGRFADILGSFRKKISRKSFILVGKRSPLRYT